MQKKEAYSPWQSFRPAGGAERGTPRGGALPPEDPEKGAAEAEATVAVVLTLVAVETISVWVSVVEDLAHVSSPLTKDSAVAVESTPFPS